MNQSRVGEVVQKPWGQYEVLWEGPGVLLKRLMIRAGEAISYQYHTKRDEYWNIVQGTGWLDLNYSKEPLGPLSSVTIIRLDRHSVSADCDTDLVIYELQVGEPDEDDIVRISDKYGRA